MLGFAWLRPTILSILLHGSPMQDDGAWYFVCYASLLSQFSRTWTSEDEDKDKDLQVGPRGSSRTRTLLEDNNTGYIYPRMCMHYLRYASRSSGHSHTYTYFVVKVWKLNLYCFLLDRLTVDLTLWSWPLTFCFKLFILKTLFLSDLFS